MDLTKAIKTIAIIIAISLATSNFTYSQSKKKPKLVVGIVIDQMRADYLYRFKSNYGKNGFNRLIREGYNVKNMHYNYVPTSTGAGHSSIYTGTTPAKHGIVSNNWYDRSSKKVINCVEDNSVSLVDGKKTTNEVSRFSRSPHNLQVTTITDELKLFSNKRSKIIGVSIKDRGAILPAGNMADYAFWYNSKTGDFNTSTYYSNDLPMWLKKFNKRKVADSLLNLTWDTLKPISKYVNSEPDDSKWETIFKGKKKPTFPYSLKKLRKKNGDFAMLPTVAYGNTIVTKLAKATIKGENMGQGNETDFLTVSYSSTDYIGHAFGIRSKEIEDTYVRMDKEITELLNFLDEYVGKDKYLLFLTADHAAADHPEYLKHKMLPGGSIDIKGIKDMLNKQLTSQFGNADYIAHIDKTYIYFNETNTPKQQLIEASIKMLSKVESINVAYSPIFDSSRKLDIDRFFRKSYNKRNSGDIIMHFNSGWMPKRKVGTTHGTAYTYDTHVPLLFFGNGIPQGSSGKKHSIDQITPTVSLLLDIPFPSASTIKAIKEVVK